MQMLYQWDLTRAPMDEVAASFWRVRTSTDATKAMAERLARGAQANAARLDGLIGEAATNWRFDRIAAVDRNLLRLGAYELDMDRDTPSSVVIDEAVEMAKDDLRGTRYRYELVIRDSGPDPAKARAATPRR